MAPEVSILRPSTLAPQPNDTTRSLARDVLIPLPPQFLEKYPGIEIELSGTDRRVDLLREGIGCFARSGSITVNSVDAY